MTRVEITIRRLVVHGRQGFDGDTFREALRREVAGQLREGRNIGGEAQPQTKPAKHPIEPIGSPIAHVASTVAGRLFK